MHTTNLDLSLTEITKIEGTATLDLKIREGTVTECNFGITEMKRFFTTAISGKPILAVPQLVARICGTCSNAHLLCSIKSIENGLGLIPSPQTMLLRKLLNFGLIIRDHGLHLYVFVLPDLFNRDSILAFDENNPVEHELLHDCFDVKEVGNKLGIITGGRSVHAPFATLGGFIKIPTKEELQALIPELKTIRPRVLHLIDVFWKCQFKQDINVKFLSLTDKNYSFLDGVVKTSDGETVSEEQFGERLKRRTIPYSQATGYFFGEALHMVGALARINLNQESLHPKTKQDAQKALAVFPSQNIYHNNLAQAIEMLHAVDSSIDLINEYQAEPEKPQSVILASGARPGSVPDSDSGPARMTNEISKTGIGLIEAPRGTLFHKMEITSDGKIKQGKIIVPTGQNQIGIEHAIREYVTNNIDQPKEILSHEIEKLIRAYDPCMSCATHFLKVRWK